MTEPTLRQRIWYAIHDLVDPIRTPSTFEAGKPWIEYHYLSDTRESVITGRSRMKLGCSICGEWRHVQIRIPRIGVINPNNEYHPERTRFIADHLHPDKARHREAWARPLSNVAGVGDIAGLVVDSLERRMADKASPAYREGDQKI